MAREDHAEIRLDDLERRVEVSGFLATLASVNVIVFTLALPVVFVLAQSEPVRAALSSYFLAGVWFFFLWTWSVAQLWRAPILLGALVCGGALAIAPITPLFSLKAELDWTIKGLFIATALVSAGFGARTLLDGWRLARSSEASSRLLTSLPYDRFAPLQACARVLGIHPICRWLRGARRSGTTLLFVMTALALAFALGTALYVVVKMLSNEVPGALNACFGQAPAAQCALALSAVIGPLILIALMLAVAAGLRRLARRSARISLADLSQSDARPPVLFLRSFIDDQVRLVLPRRPLFRRILALGEPAPRLDHVLLEEATPVGPVVAIGMPGSPPPFGAARAYFHEHEWRAAVAELAAAARAIVVVADDSDGVLWELSHIRQGGFTGKTLYLLPPRLAGLPHAARIIGREIAASPGETGAGPASGSVDSGRVCVGWYQSAPGLLRILTTATPTSTSYTCALRLALGPWSDHGLAELASGRRNAQCGKKRPRTRSKLVAPVVVLGMLLPIATLAGMDMHRSLVSTRAASARVELRELANALERYYFDAGDYPPQDVGLRALIEAPPGATGWSGPYVAGSPRFLDPWGRPYIYRKPGETEAYDLLSLGRDGRPGGSGEDADITSRSR